MRTHRRHRAHQRRTSTRRATHRPASTRPWRILATTLLTGLLLAGGWLLWQQHIIPPGSRTGHQLPVLGDPLVTRQPGNLSAATDLPASSTTPIVPSINTISLAPADPALAQSMLEAINQDRQAHGLKPVAWDDTAAYAGALHAADMATHDYFSHWNRSGYGPEYRYNRVGGRDSVMENISTYSYRFDDGRPAPITDFMPIIEQAQTGLMNSPGHRANILKPEHTHVGIGFAYNPETGSFYLAQEFVSPFAYFRNEFIKIPHERVKNGHLGSISPHMVTKIAEMFYTSRNRVRQSGENAPNFVSFSASSGVEFPFSAQKNKRTVSLSIVMLKCNRSRFRQSTTPFS